MLIASFTQQVFAQQERGSLIFPDQRRQFKEFVKENNFADLYPPRTGLAPGYIIALEKDHPEDPLVLCSDSTKSLKENTLDFDSSVVKDLALRGQMKAGWQRIIDGKFSGSRVSLEEINISIEAKRVEQIPVTRNEDDLSLGEIGSACALLVRDALCFGYEVTRIHSVLQAKVIYNMNMDTQGDLDLEVEALHFLRQFGINADVVMNLDTRGKKSYSMETEELLWGMKDNLFSFYRPLKESFNKLEEQGISVPSLGDFAPMPCGISFCGGQDQDEGKLQSNIASMRRFRTDPNMDRSTCAIN